MTRDVWIEPLVRNDIGYSGRARLLEDHGERCDVMCLDGPLARMILSIPQAGVLTLIEADA